MFTNITEIAELYIRIHLGLTYDAHNNSQYGRYTHKIYTYIRHTSSTSYMD